MSGYIARTPSAARRATVRATFTLYRAPSPGATGTAIKRISVQLRPGQGRRSVQFSVRRTAVSRTFVWFGFVDYTVSAPRSRDRRFTGAGRSALYRVR